MPDNWTLWGVNKEGLQYGCVQLQNEFIRSRATNTGASIVDVEVPDRAGEWANVTVSSPDPEYYMTNIGGLGATPGRFANRIARGQFNLDGMTYNLAINNGPNHLHGGKLGFGKRTWQVLNPQPDRVTFRLVSADGDEGYPGELTTDITYSLQGHDLVIEYKAVTDAPTVLNLTNHAYWNLSGDGKIYDQMLKLNADRVLETDADVLPTGKILDVAGTPFDFRSSKRIGKDIEQVGNGYDCCFLINGWDQTLRPAAWASDSQSGRTMEVLTTEPGVQLYTANHFNKQPATAGKDRHTSFCLECQHLPDAPNQPSFPSTVLRPGETYHQKTIYRFGIM